MVEKIDTLYEKLDQRFDKLMHLMETFLDAFFHVIDKSLFKVSIFFKQVLDKLSELIQANSKFLRYVSFPWSSIIPKVWVWWFKNSKPNYPILQPGMHMVRAPVGGGKSLTSATIAYIQLQLTGYPSYFTAKVEKPKLTDDGKFWYTTHRVIDLADYYKDGKKVKEFNTKNRKFIHKDERSLEYLPRENRSKEYNNKFIPEHKDELIMRHKGFLGIYKYSQHFKLDALEMDALTYMHDVSIVKDLPVGQWLKDGELRIFPTLIYVESYKVATDFKGVTERYLVCDPYFIEIPYEEVLMNFDTTAEANRDAGLPLDYE
ncbi:MAG TPA: hypothetical protein VK005_01860 [Acholeplasma sp.]|nr:hypothetical protein [Acholeplasma sp.]